MEHFRARHYFPSIENYLPLFYENSCSIFEHLSGGMAADEIGLPTVFADAELLPLARQWLQKVKESYLQIDPLTTPVLPPEQIYLTEDELAQKLSPLEGFYFSTFDRTLDGQWDQQRNLLHEYEVISLRPLSKPDLLNDHPSESESISLEDCLRQFLPTDIKFVVGNAHQAEKIAALISSRLDRERAELFLPFQEEAHVESVPPGVSPSVPPVDKFEIWQGDLGAGFISGKLRIACLTIEALGFEKAKIFKTPLKKNKQTPFDFSEIKKGDLVVHAVHGIGRFLGLTRLSIQQNETSKRDGEFLLLAYLNDDKLYLPVERLSLLKRYIRGDEGNPLLDRLGGSAFIQRKSRAAAAIEKIARELLELYARRKIVQGHAFSAAGPDFASFESDFKFIETADQLKAMEEVYADMEAPRPMDRLVCGDVGYGKTEVAMRACYRACMDGRQVAVIAPTTILVMQHTQTFRQRFASTPVHVGHLSRLQTRREQVSTIKDLHDGKIDVLIGTHRILSADVIFPRLGLIVVDEEQRFGVAAKEKIKLMKQEVDVLTLTATPIPRTLQFSILGLRDLSIIDTPPINRKAVKTFVLKSDDHFIRDAILKEMARGGQIFLVHNVVKTMPALTSHLQKLVPECRFGFAHGQMNKGELETTMIDFIGQKLDCLVASAIIESGLDIPNVNTLIINRADRFGRAQLY